MITKSELNKIILAPTVSIKEAAKTIQSEAIKLILVCDHDNYLLGTLTDGDLRRALVNSISHDQCIENIMNRTPIVARQSLNIDQIKQIMSEKSIRHLPEVNEKGQVTNLYFFDAIERKALRKDNIVVLMAGGKGLRLRPLTQNTPKPLLDVGGRPVLEHIIEQLITHGFHKFYISVNYLGYMIEDYFGDGSKWGVEITYLYEDEELGTAGALSYLENQEEPFLVMNGDIITKLDFVTMLDLCQNHVKAVIGAREYSHTIPYGCLEIKDSYILDIKEKPSFHYFINGGVYALTPEVLKYIPKGQYMDMPDLFQTLIENDIKTTYYHIAEEWIDIGSKDHLNWARQLYHDSGKRDD